MIYFILFCVGGLWTIDSLELRIFWDEVCGSNWLRSIESEWIGDIEAVSLDHDSVEVHRVFLEVCEECSTFRVRWIIATWSNRLRKFELVHFIVTDESGSIVQHQIWEESEKLCDIRENLQLQLEAVNRASMFAVLFLFILMLPQIGVDVKIFAAFLLLNVN